MSANSTMKVLLSLAGIPMQILDFELAVSLRSVHD
jgi:hypothetical protein